MLKEILNKYVPKSTNDFYIMIYTVSTIFMILLYIVVYFGISENYGKKYLPLVVTLRNVILSVFLIYFYNPFRKTYEYGRALPIFATAAGISLLLTIKRFDFLNLVHFCLYGKLLEHPFKY
jgi:hypothetical protein